ncbi:hypothetical protein [Iodobacter fluviatilis]|uniref:Lipoprotein n=1 Tax=Iodobacter fluviatilis TaxID=537 RepID=A0A377Q5A9_9NEIS|nr:hypothetical protein [Iodobacter fluviatilis]TCU81530.1 hypothetical protein EV682_12145 [Iodobacter fluviatilis]STQ89900.1 Uncharacterised protein [Iodobacter fluviatilis]
MAILKHTTKIVAGFFIVLSFAAYASECESIPAAVLIHDWVGELPKQAELQIYKGDSKFIDKKKSVIERKNIEFYQPKPEYLPTLEIDFSELESTRLPINADFILVIDNKIEYRFSEIEPPIKRFGCPVRGKVNGCEFGGNIPTMSTNLKCGKRISQSK